MPPTSIVTSLAGVAFGERVTSRLRGPATGRVEELMRSPAQRAVLSSTTMRGMVNRRDTKDPPPRHGIETQSRSGSRVVIGSAAPRLNVGTGATMQPASPPVRRWRRDGDVAPDAETQMSDRAGSGLRRLLGVAWLVDRIFSSTRRTPFASASTYFMRTESEMIATVSPNRHTIVAPIGQSLK